MKRPFPVSHPWIFGSISILVVLGLVVMVLLNTMGATKPLVELKVGLYENHPKIFTNSQGKPDGLFVEILNAIAKSEGWSITYVPGTWSEGLSRLESQEIDLMPDLALTPGRQELYDFHRVNVVSSWSLLLTRKNEPLFTLKELHGKRIAILEGAVQLGRLQEMLAKDQVDVRFLFVNSLEDGLLAVRNGLAQAAVSNIYFASANAWKYDLIQSAIMFEPIGLYYAAKKGHHGAILATLDSYLETWKANPQSSYYESLNRARAIPLDDLNTRTISLALWIVCGVLGLALVIIGLGLYFNHRLRVVVAQKTKDLKTAHEAQVQAEEDARNIDVFRALVFQQSHVPMAIIHGSTGRLVDCNEAAFHASGISTREEYLGQGVLGVSAPIQYDGTPSLQKAQEFMNEALRKGRVSFDWLHQRSDGTQWDGHVEMLRFTAQGEQYLQYSAIDITAQRRSTQALIHNQAALETLVEQRTKELFDANQKLQEALVTIQIAQGEVFQKEKLASLGTLVAGLSHELNTPLGNAYTMGSSLVTQVSNLKASNEQGSLTKVEFNNFVANLEESIQVLARNLQRASGLVDNFKDVAMDQASNRRRVFDLRTTIVEVMSTLDHELRKNSHGVINEVPPGINLDSYPGTLDQVLINLTVNSLVHGFEGKPGGTIRVSVIGEANTHVSLGFHDNGRGISPEHIGRIFDPFFTTKLGRGGSGLGLHLVHSMVTEVLGGTITVGSNGQDGTFFQIRLPLVAPGQAMG